MSEGFLSRWARLKRSREQAQGAVDENGAPAPHDPTPAIPDPAADGSSAATGPGASSSMTSVAGPSGSVASAPGAIGPADHGDPGPSHPAAHATSEDPNEDLPPIASLTPDSDFTPFLRRGVAPDARNAALKKLFADPHYNVMDGLDVYIEDYNVVEPIPEAMLARLVRDHAYGFAEAAGAALPGEAPTAAELEPAGDAPIAAELETSGDASTAREPATAAAAPTAAGAPASGDAGSVSESGGADQPRLANSTTAADQIEPTQPVRG